MNEQRMIDALQKVHELTQQNAPESAGAAWMSLMIDVIARARLYTQSTAVDVIAGALRDNEMPISELLS